MKLISLLALTFSLNAFAESSNWVCEKLVACGLYQAADVNEGRNVVRELKLTPVGSSGVRLEFGTIDGQQRMSPGKVMRFHRDGSFTVGKSGALSSTGICGENACTISAEPLTFKGKLFHQVTVIRFADNSLQLVKVTVDAQGAVHPSSVTFYKINDRAFNR